MNDLYVHIIRLSQQPYPNPVQTIGKLYVKDKQGILFSCYTLELPWLDNQRRISCIPAGTYDCRKRLAAESPSRSYDHIWVQDVPNRSWILIHSGNFHTHTMGCILTGTSLRDLNNDGLCDVVGSMNALREIMRLLPNFFPLVITYRT